MRIVILFLVGCAALAGCATPPHGDEAISWTQVKKQIPPKNSMIYIVRPATSFGGITDYSVSINGTHAADLESGTYFSYQAPSGRVSISVEPIPNLLNSGFGFVFMDSPKLTITTAEGEIYFVNVGADNSGGPMLANIDPSTGELLVKNAGKMGAAK